MHQLFLQFLLNQIYKLTDYLILLFLFLHCFYFCIKKLQFSSTYILLDSFTFSILACLLTGYCGLFVAMHLFASSGHNDENDVSNDVDVVEDDDNDGEGDNVVDGDVDDNGDGDNNGDGKNHDDDEVPFCERPQWHLFR